MVIPNIEPDPVQSGATDPVPAPPGALARPISKKRGLARLRSGAAALVLLGVYGLGLGSGYLAWGRARMTASQAPASPPAEAPSSPGAPEPAAWLDQLNLPEGHTLPVSFGDLGPKLLEAGAIDRDAFAQVYKQAGKPLSSRQLKILTERSDTPIVVDRDSAYFLLNFFWALGLTNQNSILEKGAMMQYGEGEIGRFASTSGWTIGAKTATELYSSVPIITLTPEQQARLEEVASAVYRPCCNNHTAFPDCNHGMAMLGLLELMASQDASADEMFEAAKYVNAFWFPQQTLEMAMFFKAAQNQDFEEIDARELVGPGVSSGSGFQMVHKWLSEKGLLQQAPGGGSSCGV